MEKKHFLLLWAIVPSLLFSQPIEKREKYDLSKDKVLYTVGYSHLDSEWNWDYPTTINEYIKNIMTENFYLFEKYPEYVFNFTGSRRYKMMKEYYPELYPKVVDYIKQGRWYVSGSSVDEGEVNVSSSESIIRQVLYGNDYFNQEFGKVSQDYMLPDCFGFLANLPTIWNHCGLLGFSTQKLTWHSAVGVPFNVGVWEGPDGSGIISALNATSYGGRVNPRLDLDEKWDERIAKNIAENDYSFDFRYYGVGDEGGAPRERDVKNAIASLNNDDSKFKVVLTSSDQIYKDITPEIRKKLPTYKGDMLLIEHSAGSQTSQAYMKKINRKNELMAQSAEQLASVVDWYGAVDYPSEKLNNAWDLVLGSQFHDILPGTSIPEAYEYAWNDEFIAANGFAEVLKNSVSVLSSTLNTQCKGRAIVVYNPVAQDREDVVTAEIEYEKLPSNVQVYDGKGKALKTQVISSEGNKLKIIFLAKVPSVGLAVFDVRETSKQPSKSSILSVKDKLLENEFYKVTFNDNGDMISILDKKAQKEMLAKPARLEFLKEEPEQWPAWNMDWKDRQNPPVGFMNEESSLQIIENGPVRVAIKITRKGKNSEISQIVSLSAGEAGKRIEVSNNLDWQSRGVSLKAAFPLTVNNNLATYNLGVGAIQRENNNSVKFEVPSKEWFDLSNESGDYGVSILEDCKYGSDKPDDNTLRLTLLYTPYNKNWYRPQKTQDWGIHEFSYGIYGHKGTWDEGLSPWQGKFFNQPMMAFEAPNHKGKAGKEMSLLSMSSPQVGLMAFKKMEHGDYYIVRVNELLGKDSKSLAINFPGKILDAYEVNGQEQKIGDANFAGNALNFDINHYAIRSFAVKLAPSNKSSEIQQEQLSLPYNQDALSYDNNRDDGRFSRRASIPAELVFDEIISEGIEFKMGSKTDGEDNVIRCQGQQIAIPEGNYNKLYLLAAAYEDTDCEFKVDEQSKNLHIQKWTDFIGQHYNRKFDLDGETVVNIESPYSKQDNIAWFASHRHQSYPSKNEAYQYCYIYKYEINIPQGAKTITLPDNPRVRVFAITAAKTSVDDITPLLPLYDDFKNSKEVTLRETN